MVWKFDKRLLQLGNHQSDYSLVRDLAPMKVFLKVSWHLTNTLSSNCYSLHWGTWETMKQRQHLLWIQVLNSLCRYQLCWSSKSYDYLSEVLKDQCTLSIQFSFCWVHFDLKSWGKLYSFSSWVVRILSHQTLLLLCHCNQDSNARWICFSIVLGVGIRNLSFQFNCLKDLNDWFLSFLQWLKKVS